MCRDHDPSFDVGYEEEGPYAFDGLVGKQALFVIAYCGRAKSNATEAAKIAGYTPNGKRTTLQTTGSMLMKMPKIKAAILKRFDALSAPGEEILKRMTDDARLDIAPLIQFDDDGKPFVHLTPEVLEVYGTLIKELETDPKTGQITKVKLVDSQAARRDLAKIRRLYTDGPIINIWNLQELSDGEVAERLEAARARITLTHHHGEGNGQ